MEKKYCHRANRFLYVSLMYKKLSVNTYLRHLIIIKTTRRSSYRTTVIYNYKLYYIPCRPSYQGLVFDAQPSTHGTDMRNVRVHRQNRGTAIYGQPQTDGAEEHTHRL